MYIISGCLLGHNCKYNGGNNRNEDVIRFCSNHRYIAVCPERAGGLPCPRPPAERSGNRIMSRDGKDVTEEFFRGARISLDSCRKMAELSGEKIDGAILKANSPSCGAGHIYDGTFSGRIVEGNGVFASMMTDLGIEVITEKEKIKW